MSAARHRQHLLLAARQRAGELRAALGQHREVPVRASQILGEAAAAATRVGAQAEVLLDGEVHEGAAALRHVRDAAAHHVFGRPAGDRAPVEA
jgi:hypothetical protein